MKHLSKLVIIATLLVIGTFCSTNVVSASTHSHQLKLQAGFSRVITYAYVQGRNQDGYWKTWSFSCNYRNDAVLSNCPDSVTTWNYWWNGEVHILYVTRPLWFPNAPEDSRSNVWCAPYIESWEPWRTDVINYNSSTNQCYLSDFEF